ncbi:MAG: hypothetical protein LBI64_03145 [Coriobacteriales bacterium]|nr:hypothetical protein [Coriobacteriales bacterium]
MLMNTQDNIAVVGIKGAPRQVEAIADFISGGIEHGCGACIGLEIEHFVVTREGQEPVTYEGDASRGQAGVGAILDELAAYYDARIYEDHEDGSRSLIGLSRLKANVTLEPGAQLEISIGPAVRLSTLHQLYTRFRTELDPILERHGYELLSLGYHPSACAFELPLLPKQRYHYMDEYFTSTGSHGICMMRATASTQVSIDFASEEDAVRKYRVAMALGPLLSFITDNSPIFEGMPVHGVGNGEGSAGDTAGSNESQRTLPTGARSGLPIPPRMARTAIWEDVDPARSTTPPHTFEDRFGFADYASSLLAAPAVFSLQYDDDLHKHAVYQGMRANAEVYGAQALDLERVEHILSLFFFDVRFKTYIEIRMADSLPAEYAFSYAALIKGLFYRAETMERYGALAERLTPEEISLAKQTLMLEGFDALVYGRPASEWLDELLGEAAKGLDADEQPYLMPLAELVENRRTLIDD